MISGWAPQSKAAVVVLDGAGKVQWVRDVAAAEETRVGKVAFASNGDVFYAGHARGELDLGGGAIPFPADPSTSSFFVVRRTP